MPGYLKFTIFTTLNFCSNFVAFSSANSMSLEDTFNSWCKVSAFMSMKSFWNFLLSLLSRSCISCLTLSCWVAGRWTMNYSRHVILHIMGWKSQWCISTETNREPIIFWGVKAIEFGRKTRVPLSVSEPCKSRASWRLNVHVKLNDDKLKFVDCFGCIYLRHLFSDVLRHSCRNVLVYFVRDMQGYIFVVLGHFRNLKL